MNDFFERGENLDSGEHAPFVDDPFVLFLGDALGGPLIEVERPFVSEEMLIGRRAVCNRRFTHEFSQFGRIEWEVLHGIEVFSSTPPPPFAFTPRCRGVGPQSKKEWQSLSLEGGVKAGRNLIGRNLINLIVGWSVGWCRQREKIDWQEARKFDCQLVRTIFIFCCPSSIFKSLASGEQIKF